MNISTMTQYLDADFYTGVPDSQLKKLCDYLIRDFGISTQHMIAANEGNCTALAAGYHLATGKIPVVYLQNSGIGNIINPAASLLHEKVYGIPCIFLVGWRGEPGVKDEPQHIYQGEVTIRLLEDMDIKTYILGKETTEEELSLQLREGNILLQSGKSIAFIVRKEAFSDDAKVTYQNTYTMSREEIIRLATEVSGEDLMVSTTGKASRELFEIREANRQSHQYDFLTVGSMGHASSIALGIALHKPSVKVWCMDGDGAVLMHMGAMALIGSNKPGNMVHLVINNEAHETVGGMPTVANQIDLVQIAKGCGYPNAICVETASTLQQALKEAKERNQLSFIEVKASIGAREDLGRPTTSARENKESFMNYIKNIK